MLGGVQNAQHIMDAGGCRFGDNDRGIGLCAGGDHRASYSWRSINDDEAFVIIYRVFMRCGKDGGDQFARILVSGVEVRVEEITIWTC